ncbi:MAG: hypothetical protein WDN03_04995 [Rhizomicrobium sp.]
MTKINSYAPAQHSAFQANVSSLFSVAILVMAGLMTFAAFATV